MKRRFRDKYLIFFLASALVGGIFVREFFLHRPPVDPLGPSSELTIIDSGLDNNDIPAIDQPVFESVAAADAYLENTGRGIVLAEGGRAKFYPFQILVWHYAVNDQWKNEPILVTYNPLCESALVFERTVFGQILEFKNSGRLYNNAVLFVDSDRGQFWSSLTGQAIDTSFATDQILALLPSVTMTWQNFKKRFPQGQVLSRPTGLARDYSRNPYGDYAASPDILFPLDKYDSSQPIKTKIFAYGEAVYSEDAIRSARTVDDQSVRFVWDEDWQTVRAYRLDDGVSTEEEVGVYSGFWFCWAARAR